jgi:hypothetical protein
MSMLSILDIFVLDYYRPVSVLRHPRAAVHRLHLCVWPGSGTARTTRIHGTYPCVCLFTRVDKCVS